MFKNTKFLYSAVLLLVLSTRSSAHDSILDYDTTIQMNSEGTLYITEIIKINLTNTRDANNIYRELPLKYKLHTNLKIDSVTRNGKKVKFYTSLTGDYLRIYFAKKGKVIPAGMNVYIIKYRLENLVDFHQNYEMLNYSVISQDWRMQIENLVVTVKLPSRVDPLRINAFIDGSEQSAMEQGLDIDDQVVFESNREIEAEENVVLTVMLPKNTISKPLWRILEDIDSYVSLLILFLSFSLMLKPLMALKKVNYSKYIENAVVSSTLLCISVFFIPKYRYSFTNSEFFMIIILILLPFICVSRRYKKLFSNEFSYYFTTFLLLLTVDGYFSMNFSLVPTFCLFLILGANILLACYDRLTRKKMV